MRSGKLATRHTILARHLETAGDRDRGHYRLHRRQRILPGWIWRPLGGAGGTALAIALLAFLFFQTCGNPEVLH